MVFKIELAHVFFHQWVGYDGLESLTTFFLVVRTMR